MQTSGAPGLRTRWASANASAISLLVEAAGFVLAAVVPVRSNHRFVAFRGQLAAEVVRVEEANAALQPDIEEVGQVGIGDVVVVRRVGDNSVLALVQQRQTRRRSSEAVAAGWPIASVSIRSADFLQVLADISRRAAERVGLSEVPHHRQRLPRVGVGRPFIRLQR